MLCIELKNILIHFGRLPIFTIIFSACLLITIAFIYMDLKKQKGEKKNFKSKSFIITLLWGLMLYLVGNFPKEISADSIVSSILQSLYSTARMFSANSDYNDLVQTEIKTSFLYLISFWLTHLAAVVIVAMALVSVFGKRLMFELRLHFSKKKDRFIIYGVNAKSICFAKNIMSQQEGESNRRMVVFVDESADKQSKQEVFEMGATILHNSIFIKNNINKFAAKKAGLSKTFKKNIYIFAFTGSDVLNASITNGIIKFVAENNLSSDSLRGIYIYTDSTAVKEDIEKNNKSDISINYFFEEELAARKLFEIKPLYKLLSFDVNTGLPLPNKGVNIPTITILILGFGITGKHILRQAICRGQFEGANFHAIVIDKDMNSKKGAFFNDYPALDEENYNNPNRMHIDFIQDDVGSSSFYNMLEWFIMDEDEKKTFSIDYVVSTLGNDDINFNVITCIQRFLRRNGISPNNKNYPVLNAHITDRKYQLINGGETEKIDGIQVFGDYDDIFTFDVIVNEKMDSMAKAVLNMYPEKSDWASISTFDKDQNRAVASSIDAFLYIMGFVRSDFGHGKVFKSKESLESYFCNGKESLLENLAKTEHLRWNAFHFANGWTKKPLINVKSYKDRTDEPLKQKICLTSWDELLEISEFLKKVDHSTPESDLDFQEKDRSNILAIYDMIDELSKAAGASVRRDDMKVYVPSPIDTSIIQLPEEISGLIEQLAENTHEVWAMQRLADGWKYGTKRNDARKIHPCLVPYNELPESEKVYDRNTATEALKCIVSMGYIIDKKQ